MITLAQTVGTNDIYISNGDLARASGIDAYGIILADAVRTVLGEVQLDLDLGVDYEETIWKNNSSLNNWRESVVETIRSYDFVKGIERFTSSIDKSGKLSYSIKITTDIGTVQVES